VDFLSRPNGDTLSIEIDFYLVYYLISSINCSNNLLSGGFVASLPGGASDLPSFLSSPVINSHAYEWKCLRFWYFIGDDDVDDWYTASLMVNVRAVTSNQTILLFFEEEVTNKAQYTQIPLPSNYTNAQVYLQSSCLHGSLFTTDKGLKVIV